MPTPLARQLRPGSELLAELAPPGARLLAPASWWCGAGWTRWSCRSATPGSSIPTSTSRSWSCATSGHLVAADRPAVRALGGDHLARSDRAADPFRGQQAARSTRARSATGRRPLLTPRRRDRHAAPTDLPAARRPPLRSAGPRHGPVTTAAGGDPDRPRGLPSPRRRDRTRQHGPRREGQVLARHRSPSGAEADAPRSHDAPARRRGPGRAPPPGATHRVAARPRHRGRGRRPEPSSLPARRSSRRAVVDEPSPVTVERAAPGRRGRRRAARRGRRRRRRWSDRRRPARARRRCDRPARPRRPQVDVQNLTKAVDIGQELTRRAAIIDAALADGAAEAHLLRRVGVRAPGGRAGSPPGSGPAGARPTRASTSPTTIGTPIYAITDGVVEDAGPAAGFGLWVVLRHDDGTQSVYGHVNRMFVRSRRRGAGRRGDRRGRQPRALDRPAPALRDLGRRRHEVNPVRWLRSRGIDFVRPTRGRRSRVDPAATGLEQASATQSSPWLRHGALRASAAAPRR